MTGKISNLPIDKSFGFISGEDGLEYFFHESDVADRGMDDLRRTYKSMGGNKVKVTFEASKTSKGPRASNVTISF